MRAGKDIDLTDAVTELVQLGEFLRDIRNDTNPAYLVFSTFLGVPPESCQFLELITAAATRCDSLHRFVLGVESPFITAKHRARVLQSIKRFGTLFTLAGLATPWTPIKEASLSESLLSDMESFANAAREHRPLRKPPRKKSSKR